MSNEVVLDQAMTHTEDVLYKVAMGVHTVTYEVDGVCSRFVTDRGLS